MNNVNNRDGFINAFLECLLWSSTDFEGNPLDDDYGIEDIDEEVLKEIENDCDEFIKGSLHMIGDRMQQAGHDFCLTRNGHGAGFWDGDWPEYGDELTKWSKTFGSMEIYPIGDGKLGK